MERCLENLQGKEQVKQELCRRYPTFSKLHFPKTFFFNSMQPKGRTAAGSHPYKEHNCKCLLSLFHNNAHNTNTELKRFTPTSRSLLEKEFYKASPQMLQSEDSYGFFKSRYKRKAGRLHKKKCVNDVVKAV